MPNDRVLIVDDDQSWRELLRETLLSVFASSGAPEISLAASYEQALALLQRRHFHMAFIDLRLREHERELQGKLLARRIAESGEATSVVISTAHADVSTVRTALKEWHVLDVLLKDEWEPGKLIALLQQGLQAARTAYQRQHESPVDLLRGDQPILAWVAQVLGVIGADRGLPRADRRLNDLLNALLDGLYPLLPARQHPAARRNPSGNSYSAQFWSKALGQPLLLRFGHTSAIEQLTSFDDAGLSFVQIERRIDDPQLGAAGVVLLPAVPDVDAFVHGT